MVRQSGRITSTIKEQVYRILKHEISTGQLIQGQWLQEKELAKRLDVSRSPIREALLMLAADGLVVEYPNKGVFVRTFSEHDIEEIYDMRVMMESYAILNCQANLSDEDREELRLYREKFVTMHAADDLDSYIEVDNALHYLFIRLSGNSLLVQSYLKLNAIVQQFRMYSLITKQRFDESVDEHTGVIDGILSGALQKAIDTNHKHLLLAKDKIIDYLRNTEDVAEALSRRQSAQSRRE
ncbi:MAG: GntR family transcriptional regulator [Planctomycetaceae bacterium]|nr:GntR family transcriptional regulator [Planctomycetaceae bacterium]